MTMETGSAAQFNDGLLPYATALSAASSNKFRAFTKKGPGGHSGAERIREKDFPDIQLSPKFRIFGDDPIFTIGSCFARNVEHQLVKRGMVPLTRNCLIPDEYYEITGVGARNGALNAYTPSAMLDTLRLIDRPDRNSAGILQIADDKFMDMMMSGLRPLNAVEQSNLRNQFLDTYATLPQARAVFITLGYTETWFDTKDRIFVNRSPAGDRATMRHGNRYAFTNITSAQAIQAVDSIISHIRMKTSDRAKIVMTTSPVPLGATFTARDVISANLYSKSTLVSAAMEAAGKYDFVDYYPSYEMVTMGPADKVWEPDGVHVRLDYVADVVERFIAAYMS